MIKMATLAPIVALSLLAPTAGFAEDLPNWDINRAALYESQSLIEYAQNAMAKDGDADGRNSKVLKIPPDVLFTRYVAYEAHCVAYLRAHWGDYSEFIQLNAIQEETTSGLGPSYCLLLARADLRSGRDPNVNTGEPPD